LERVWGRGAHDQRRAGREASCRLVVAAGNHVAVRGNASPCIAPLLPGTIAAVRQPAVPGRARFFAGCPAAARAWRWISRAEGSMFHLSRS